MSETDLEKVARLKREIEEAQARIEAAKAAEQAAYWDWLKANLTIEAINVFCPEHDRSSCNDSNTANGHHSAEYGPRCTRCALIDTMHGLRDERLRLRVVFV